MQDTFRLPYLMYRIMQHVAYDNEIRGAGRHQERSEHVGGPTCLSSEYVGGPTCLFVGVDTLGVLHVGGPTCLLSEYAGGPTCLHIYIYIYMYIYVYTYDLCAIR